MNKKLNIILLASLILPNIYAIDRYTVIIQPDKKSIVFVNKEHPESPSESVQIVSFNVNAKTVMKNDISTFNWVVKNADILKFNGMVIDNKLNSYTVHQSQKGSYTYVLEAIDVTGKSTSSSLSVDVHNVDLLNSFSVDKLVVSSTTNTTLTFNWTTPKTPLKLRLTNNLGYSLDLNPNLTTTTYTKIHPVGNTIYTLEATDEDGEVFTKSVLVKSVGLPVINSFDFPSVIYGGQTYSVTFDATDATKYQIRSASSSTGFPTSFVDITSGDQRTVCLSSCSGTFNLVLSAINEFGNSVTLTKQLTIELSPTASIAIINDIRHQITVAPNTALSFKVYSQSAGSTLVRKEMNSASAAVVNFPTNAPSQVGTYYYYLSACKTVNNEERCSTPVTATVIVK